MKRALVIGCPGSGKSTFSRTLHRITGLPLVHLDALYWNADATTVPRDLFLRRLEAALAEDEWIIDGDYASTLARRMERCDAVFFLDLPEEICLAGALSRRGQARSDLPWTEPSEPDGEFLQRIRDYRTRKRPAVLSLLERFSDREIRVFRSRDEADTYLASLRTEKEAL